MRALIVDDEPLARSEMRRLLRAHPGVEIVGEAENASEATNLLRELRPELVFLDVQLPDGTGFDVLAALASPPAVIFTTAYDQYALRAFEFRAFDYLLKPVDPVRLARALQLLAPTGAAPAPDASAGEESSDEAGGSSQTPLRADERFLVRDGSRSLFIEVGQISLAESDGNYTRLHFGGRRALVARSLNYVAARLDPALFFRASRTHLLNLRRIGGIESWFQGGLVVVMEDGTKVELSRRRAQEFRARTSL